MNIDELEPRDDILWWRHWGQVGRAASDLDRSLTPESYYGALFVHMRDGGPVPPLKVGHWQHGKPGQTYVHDGHHRFAIARELGWRTLPVEPADPDYETSERYVPQEVRQRTMSKLVKLTYISGIAVLVNLDRVEKIDPEQIGATFGIGSRLGFNRPENEILVTETQDEILALQAAP